MSKTVVLAFSGGLDTSVCVKWLVDRGYKVVCFMADVGQGEPSAMAVKRGKIAGASQIIVRDLRKAFVTDYCWPSLKAQAVYEGGYLLATALSRPLIAEHLVEVAHKAGAFAVAHGCTGKGNDQVRFEVTTRILDPKLEIIAPVREWEFKTREEEIDYALSCGIPVDVNKRSPYSIDENLWGTSIEAGVLENPWNEPPADTYRSIRSPEKTLSKAGYVTVRFAAGIPVSLDGKRYDPVALVKRANQLGALHGIGRSDMIESRMVGIKSREVYEAPGGTILLRAHEELERLVLDRELLQFKQGIAARYAQMVYAGLWFTPLKRSLDAFINDTQKHVTGEVRLKLYRATAQVVGRKSPYSLYKEKLATYSAGDQFDLSHAKGFIKLFGLPYEGAGG